jgi:hypothetical protein
MFSEEDCFLDLLDHLESYREYDQDRKKKCKWKAYQYVVVIVVVAVVVVVVVNDVKCVFTVVAMAQLSTGCVT